MIVQWNEVIEFWFNELSPKQWWIKDENLDQEISKRFLTTLKAASHCEFYTWRTEPQGRLAEIIVLDQFSRNIFRNKPQAFSQDPLAVALCQEAVSHGYHKELNDDQKQFLFMPLMHSESLKVHEQAMELFGSIDRLEFEIKHKKIIEQFGRYPHRNDILGRESTPEEIAFLKQPGSSF